jgi:peptide deformylase
VPVDSYPALPPEVERGSVRRITVVGEEILHRASAAVPAEAFGSAELAALVDDMFTTMYVARGAGLAANQVDVDLRLFVWDITDDLGVRHVGHMANPVVDPVPTAARRLVEAGEGCLSVPGPYRALPRPDRAVLRGQDVAGNPLVIEGTGYFARCLLHEFDHLEGTLYVDRLSKRDRKSALAEMEQRREEVFAMRADRARTIGK